MNMNQDEWEQGLDASETWIQKWPNYCRSCYGWGKYPKKYRYFTNPKDREYDDLFHPPGFCEERPENACHRCAHGKFVPKSIDPTDGSIVEYHCDTCGWYFNDGMPFHPTH